MCALVLQAFFLMRGVMFEQEDGRRTAEEFELKYGAHPYLMEPARFQSLHGFSQAAAHRAGLFPSMPSCPTDVVTNLEHTYVQTAEANRGEGYIQHFLRGTYVVDSLCLPDTSPQCHVEEKASAAMDRGFVTWPELQEWIDEVPAGALARGTAQTGTDRPLQPSKVFTTGAYSRAAFHGLRTNTGKFPWLTCLLCSIVRNIAPQHKFTTLTWARNVMTVAHKDSHNDGDSKNLILPCSTFAQGSLWLEDSAGEVLLSAHGPKGKLWNTRRPCMFCPRTLHATMPWAGDRLILVAFHVRNADRLSWRDVHLLCKMGFYPMAYSYTNRSQFEAEACNEDCQMHDTDDADST